MKNDHVEIIPAIMPHDRSTFEVLVASIAPVSQVVQLDVMDGVFVPATSWPFVNGTVESIELPPSPLTWEVDLMVRAQAVVGVSCAQAGFERIICHIEAFENANDVREACQFIRGAGAKEIGMALVCDTPLSSVLSLVEDKSIDMVQVMSISPVGVQGSPFDERSLARVAELRVHYPDLTIAVDGGVNEAHIQDLVRAGANRLSIGSALLRSNNMASTYAHFVDLASQAVARA